MLWRVYLWLLSWLLDAVPSQVSCPFWRRWLIWSAFKFRRHPKISKPFWKVARFAAFSRTHVAMSVYFTSLLMTAIMNGDEPAGIGYGDV